VAASPSSGVQHHPWEGLAKALAGAQFLVDGGETRFVPRHGHGCFEILRDVRSYLLAAEAAAGVGHHVALSVVAPTPACSGYFGQRWPRKPLITGFPDSLSERPRNAVLRVRGQHRPIGHDGQTVRLSALMQPIVWMISRRTGPTSQSGTGERHVELASPEPIRLDELVGNPERNRDTRKVITESHTRYFGTELNDQKPQPGDNPRLGPTVSKTGSAASYLRGKVKSQTGARRAASVHHHELTLENFSTTLCGLTKMLHRTAVCARDLCLATRNRVLTLKTPSVLDLVLETKLTSTKRRTGNLILQLHNCTSNTITVHSGSRT